MGELSLKTSCSVVMLFNLLTFITTCRPHGIIPDFIGGMKKPSLKLKTLLRFRCSMVKSKLQIIVILPGL
jgi:hypothetical protein